MINLCSNSPLSKSNWKRKQPWEPHQLLLSDKTLPVSVSGRRQRISFAADGVLRWLETPDLLRVFDCCPGTSGHISPCRGSPVKTGNAARHRPSLFGLLSSQPTESPCLFDWAILMFHFRLGNGGHFSTANEKQNSQLKWNSKSFPWGGLQFFAVFTVFRPDYRLTPNSWAQPNSWARI